MKALQRHIAKVSQLEKQLGKVAQDAVRDNVDIIIGLLVEGQLHKGIMSDGGEAPPYQLITEVFFANDPANPPRMRKIAGEPWNFDWSGNWVEGMAVKSIENGYDIFSRDGKTAILEAAAGGRLTKLTEEHNKIINEEIIKPALQKFVLNNVTSF